MTASESCLRWPRSPCVRPFTPAALPSRGRRRLEGCPILEQRRLDGRIYLLVDASIVERHLVFPHRAHDALDLARRVRRRLHQDEPLHRRIVVWRVAFVAGALAQLAPQIPERAPEL